MNDQTLVCGCGNEFVFSARDQEFYLEKGFDAPKRCRKCRDEKKAKFAEKESRKTVNRIMSGEKVTL